MGNNNWHGIEEFVKVAKTGSFTKAAQELGLSKSHISKHVRMLEMRLNVKLIHRTTRKLSLTSNGKEFFQKCQHILTDLENAHHILDNQKTAPHGKIRLTVAGAFGEEFIAPLIADFLMEYPGIMVDMLFTNRAVDLIEEDFDLAIRSGVSLNTGIYSAEKIFRYELVTAAHPDYLERCGIPENLEDLKHHNCLVGTLPCWRFKEDQEIIIEGNWKSNNGHALVAAALKGIGIIQVPKFYLKGRSLKEVLTKFKTRRNDIWAIYPQNRFVPQKAELLSHFLKEKLEAFSSNISSEKSPPYKKTKYPNSKKDHT